MMGGYDMQTNFYIEYHGKKELYKKMVETIKDIWRKKGCKVKDLNNLDIYYKPEEGMCYYVINNEEEGNFPV